MRQTDGLCSPQYQFLYIFVEGSLGEILGEFNGGWCHLEACGTDRE
jgi:hypothetical protein